jgi:hypothetical protein
MKSSSRQEAVNQTAPSLRRGEDTTVQIHGQAAFMTVVLFDQEHAGEAD